MFESSKQRPGFDHSIRETGSGPGYSWSRTPPLVVVKAGAESCSAVLRWEEAGEVNGRQGEHHRLQHLLMSSAGTGKRGQQGGRMGGGGSCNVEDRGHAFLGCVVFFYGGGGAFLFGEREGAGHSVFQDLHAQCLGLS